uniref:HNH endonuclease bacteriophage, HNH Endonuclease, DNA.52A n=1 Tax=Siphoviridae sp. ctuk37 TaxID=2825715 RepID=A0A8S5TVE8_9CAUD|nr:MAG TPA: HNH endonuclease bacteriophage, HNH Endonuclease, DNA.52A [Siphoviridae sp. ctuk37]
MTCSKPKPTLWRPQHEGRRPTRRFSRHSSPMPEEVWVLSRIRTFSELSRIESFEDRYEYLRLNQDPGDQTFGFERYLNQSFYHSTEWRQARQKVILRDDACDLGVPGHDIYGKILVHHMNPIRPEDLEGEFNPDILDPEYLICVRHDTHNAIHFGDASLLPKPLVERTPNDTIPWR